MSPADRSIRAFGTLADGRQVDAITLGSPDGLQAEILTYGGLLRRLTFPVGGVRLDLVVSLPDLAAYVADRTYQGVIVGRCANRIAGAGFELHGRRHRVTDNERGNHLHGGALGFGKRLWRVLDLQQGAQARLVLGLDSPAGEEGYPGNLQVTAEFHLEAHELQLRFTARSDAATPLNLTYHPYFNLSGDARRGTGEHRLRINASRFLPVQDASLIPNGELAPVAGTSFDFRTPRPLHPPPASAHPQLAIAGGYDHCWVLDDGRDCDAELHCPASGLTLSVRSDRPGLQFYAGHGLAGSHAGLHGVCLEPQGFPDAVNQHHFPPVILEPQAAGATFLSYLLTNRAGRRVG